MKNYYKQISSNNHTIKISLQPNNNSYIINLIGQCNSHLRYLEEYFAVEIANRGNYFIIKGEKIKCNCVADILQIIYKNFATKPLTMAQLHLAIRDYESSEIQQKDINIVENDNMQNKLIIKTPKINVMPRGQNQSAYVKNILKHDIIFGVGPAGTGKTYLAVACAVEALKQEKVERIVLVRPVVEAGEHLGFLPGDIAQKIDPYLRPLYDALYDMLGSQQVEKLIAERIIEIAPLAFMRGRTLNSSFIILDESQNSTIEQMQMFLTRIGFGSSAVITGDITQIDLLKSKQSGLIHVLKVLKNIAGISFNYFTARDVVRHPLVQKIILAYAEYQENN